MGEDIPMFRAAFVLLAVMAVAGLSYSLISGEKVDWGWEDGKGSASAAKAVAPGKGGDDGAKGVMPTGRAAQCRVVQRPIPLNGPVSESSGLAVSGRNDGVLWTHNDSGEPVLFAINTAGALVGQVRVTGAEVEDWEDIASGPCAAGRCLYVADTGDNRGERDFVTVYRVPEPAPGDAQTEPAEALRARYPDEAQDAEALLVTPDGQIYVMTKGENGPVALYRFPQGAGAGGLAILERVRTVTEDKVERDGRITGGAVSPDGRWAAVRTLRALSFQPLEDFVSGRTESLRTVDLTSLAEPQGEAVTFGNNGDVVLTSEAGSAMGPALLSRLRCEL